MQNDPQYFHPVLSRQSETFLHATHGAELKPAETVTQLSVVVVQLLSTLHVQSDEGDTAKPWHRIHCTLHYTYDTKHK